MFYQSSISDLLDLYLLTQVFLAKEFRDISLCLEIAYKSLEKPLKHSVDPKVEGSSPFGLAPKALVSKALTRAFGRSTNSFQEKDFLFNPTKPMRIFRGRNNRFAKWCILRR